MPDEFALHNAIAIGIGISFGDADAASTIARYRNAGAGTVVLKDGAKGVIFSRG